MTQRNCDLAYCAGIIDGEGSFSIAKVAKKKRRTSPYWYLVMAVSMTKIKAVRKLCQVFGGSVKRCANTSAGNRVWGWRAWDKQAARVAEELLPYLLIKKRQAQTGIAFRKYLDEKNTKGGTGMFLTKRDMQRRESFRRQMRRLNGTA